MGQVIDFQIARGFKTHAAPAQKRCCARCGADLWHIRDNGEICCADCEAVCPYRLQTKNTK